MSCRDYRKHLIELARGHDAAPDTVSHVHACEACARFLDQQRALTAAMQTLAAQPLVTVDPAAARVLAEFDSARRRVSAVYCGIAAALAACLCAAAVWMGAPAAKPQTPAIAEAPDTRPFLTIPYTVPLTPEEPVAVVRTRIPVTQLIAAGFRVGAAAADPRALIEADVLVGEDGRARAIRPLSISMSN